MSPRVATVTATPLTSAPVAMCRNAGGTNGERAEGNENGLPWQPALNLPLHLPASLFLDGGTCIVLSFCAHTGGNATGESPAFLSPFSIDSSVEILEKENSFTAVFLASSTWTWIFRSIHRWRASPHLTNNQIK